jgi:hypothetical protein
LNFTFTSPPPPPGVAGTHSRRNFGQPIWMKRNGRWGGQRWHTRGSCSFSPRFVVGSFEFSREPKKNDATARIHWQTKRENAQRFCAAERWKRKEKNVSHTRE